MPRTVSEVTTIRDYISGVMDRADHHAGNVRDICLALAGGVIWRCDGGLKVYERSGRITNAMWFKVGTKRYAISFRHDPAQIEVREGNMQGGVLATFDNSNSVANVRLFFESL
jgi:hypothetical protein